MYSRIKVNSGKSDMALGRKAVRLEKSCKSREEHDGRACEHNTGWIRMKLMLTWWVHVNAWTIMLSGPLLSLSFSFLLFASAFLLSTITSSHAELRTDRRALQCVITRRGDATRRSAYVAVRRAASSARRRMAPPSADKRPAASIRLGPAADARWSRSSSPCMVQHDDKLLVLR